MNSSIAIKILTKNGNPRQDFFNLAGEYVLDIYSNDQHLNLIKKIYEIDQARNINVLGRPITDSESDCLLGHIGILKTSLSEWTLILEDDAIILEQYFSDLIKGLGNLKILKPTILLLYLGKRGVFKRSPSRYSKFFSTIFIHKCFALPSGSVAYVANSSARSIITESKKLVGTADWPTYSSRISFFGVFPQMIFHDFTVPSLAQVQNSAVKSMPWPTYRYKPIHMVMASFTPEIFNSFGSFSEYLKLNLLPAFFRRVSRRIKIFFIRT